MRHGPPPSLDDIMEMAETALAAIPAPLRDMVRGAAIVVEETPDDETLAEMGIESPWELTGLYRGTPLTQKSVLDVPREPDMILLYREPILLEWIETGEDLFR
ncbi:MAG: metallopeptidase family protein, partial [Acetobacteraceae bacterium]|nr:metallopeptidase family protein [Acetobacteraceae bacterium]